MVNPNLLISDKHPSEHFESRIRSAAELKRLLPYQEHTIDKLETELSEPAGKNKQCIYIHIPFCRKSCNFCGYYKCINSSPETIELYVKNLKEQIILYSTLEWVKTARFEAIYFGGGTPTLLPSELFFSLLDTIQTHLPLTPDCEVTLETTVSEINDSYFNLLKVSAVNRVSIGIQSFDQQVRSVNSRLAGNDEICFKIEKIRGAGIQNICADLMYNIEGQTIRTWENDLKQISKLALTGCSVYPLLPFPGAPIVINQTYKTPDPIEEYQFFEMADSYLTSLPSWQPFTTVQYGDEIRGTARYVQLQADDADILAFGPGAGGKINNIQYLNLFSLDEYLNHPVSILSSKCKAFQLPESYELLGKKLWLFKKGFIDKHHFEDFFRNDKELINELQNKSLLLDNGKNILLSKTGRYWAANIAALFILKYKNEL